MYKRQKKKLSGGIDIANRVSKFVDCRTKDIARRELYIVEGDSALGACKQSRDAEFQGIMPVRGKILNCLKSDYAKIFKSEIITDLLRVLEMCIRDSLSSIGATKKQMMKSVLFESVVLSAVGIPLGILAGLLGIGVTFKLTEGMFSSIIAVSTNVKLEL